MSSLLLTLKIAVVLYSEVPNLALVEAVITAESAWQLDARSSQGAVGLMQLTPIGVKEVQRVYTNPLSPCYGLKWDTILLPVNNIRAGTCLLKHYLSLYRHRGPSQIYWALVAYNAGPSWANRCRAPTETKAYIAHIEKHYGATLNSQCERR